MKKSEAVLARINQYLEEAEKLDDKFVEEALRFGRTPPDAKYMLVNIVDLLHKSGISQFPARLNQNPKVALGGVIGSNRKAYTKFRDIRTRSTFEIEIKKV